MASDSEQFQPAVAGDEGNQATITPMSRRGFLGVAGGATLLSLAAPFSPPLLALNKAGDSFGSLTVLPQDGRSLYFQALDAASSEICIEICVLEDPQILEHVQSALERGVSVRVIVDFHKYTALAAERDHLERYLVAPGGKLHLSNPFFPRSFPKVVLIDSSLLVFGSACLDETTFRRYRDFATTCTDAQVIGDLHGLFENDWAYSSPPGEAPPRFNPTSAFSAGGLIISPINSTEQLVSFFQSAAQSLDVYTEILGNFTLESELAAAVKRGVQVRLIAPFRVNGGSPQTQQRQLASLEALSYVGVDVHVNGRERPDLPYFHARAAVADGQSGYLGSLSLSPDSATVNRGVGLVFRQASLVQQLQQQFETDYLLETRKF